MRAAVVALVFLAGCPSRERHDFERAIAKLSEFADATCACKNKACVDKVQNELVVWSQEMAKLQNRRASNPDESQVKRMTASSERIAECMTRSISAPEPNVLAEKPPPDEPSPNVLAEKPHPDEPIVGAEVTPTGIPACDEYRAAILELAKCEMIPRATREHVMQSFDQAASAWVDLPAEAKRAAGTACKTATDAVRQATAACK